MTPEQIHDFLLGRYANIVPTNSWGEASYFYNPQSKLPRGTYFFTLKEKNGDNDQASGLDRTDVFRINFGLPSTDYLKVFGAKPARPAKGEIIQGDWDFIERDTLTPHPIYGWMGWVAIINPSSSTLKSLTPLIDAAYDKAKVTFEKRVK